MYQNFLRKKSKIVDSCHLVFNPIRDKSLQDVWVKRLVNDIAQRLFTPIRLAIGVELLAKTDRLLGN